MSTSAWQRPTKWNTTIAPKMASAVVFTGICGRVLLCADALKEAKPHVNST